MKILQILQAALALVKNRLSTVRETAADLNHPLALATRLISGICLVKVGRFFLHFRLPFPF